MPIRLPLINGKWLIGTNKVFVLHAGLSGLGLKIPVGRYKRNKLHE